MKTLLLIMSIIIFGWWFFAGFIQPFYNRPELLRRPRGMMWTFLIALSLFIFGRIL